MTQKLKKKFNFLDYEIKFPQMYNFFYKICNIVVVLSDIDAVSMEKPLNYF